MVRPIALCVFAAVWTLGGHAAAALIVNPPRPISDRVNVNLIAVADNDGTDSTADTFGNATQQTQIFSLVDVIYAQAGVDVAFAFRPGTYNSSFARTGTPGANSPRPTSDLNTMRSNAAAAGGVLSSDPNTINVFLVSIAPGFIQLSANSSAGLATIGGNGVAYYGGSSLLTFGGGREVLASVLAHEIGHNLGLAHNTITQNLMRSGGSDADKGQRLDAGQIQTILGSRFTIAAPPAPHPGDFNNDGVVDGADFLRWQRGGSPLPLSAVDLLAWKTNFGVPDITAAYVETASPPVPEPCGAALSALAIVSVLTASRPRSFVV
jgi:hypothetical protein